MTPADFKILGTIAALLLLLMPKRAAAATPTGEVTLGTPFVTGGYAEQLDNQGYYTEKPGNVIPADGSSSRMQDLIDESTNVIMANGGYPE